MSATLKDYLFSPRNGFDAKSLAIQLPASSNRPAEISYEQLQSLIRQLEQQLASLQLPKGAVVSSSLVNNAEFVTLFLATAQQGFIAAPLNPNYKEAEVEFYLDDTKSQLLVVPVGTLQGKGASEGALAAAAAAKKLGVRTVEVVLDVERMQIKLCDTNGDLPKGTPQSSVPDDVALVLHTSGTTGRPKAVPLTQKNLCATMHNIQDSYALTQKDKTFLVMPLFHVHGLVCGLLSSLHAGGAVVIPPRFSAASFWNEFVDTHANWYTAVPTIHQILLSTPKPDPMPTLRFIRSCSSSLSPSTFHALEDAFGTPVLEAYAMTEAAHQMTTNFLPPGKRKPGTVGLGAGVEVKILDDHGVELPVGENGEVCVRGPNVTKGYLNNEKANRDSFFRTAYNNCPPESDGFLRTGDQGRKDEDDNLVLTGRIKELINRSGEKISPLEIDSAMLMISGIQEAVSFAIPDEMYGEKVGAVVVPEHGADVNQKSIQDALSDKLIKFKIPEKIWITDAIPKTATGKIQRRNVAKAFVDP
ncbi:oxalate--CoA ligase [Malassezia vespertilionis]|nr:oxalate--CoA ligase [Malassezia vespertilionis]WFD05091.1 oxalate--CoA ligase [Malassezia vespertilionis]